MEESERLYYPPGGILIWMVIFLELFTFSMGLVAFNFYRVDEPIIFAEGQAMLNTALGMINTLVLLTSGFLMALSVQALKSGKKKTSISLMRTTALLGVLFIVLKATEYSEKLQIGIGIEHDAFFMFYWLLTGFHFIHVLIGVVILLFLSVRTGNAVYGPSNLADIEAGAAFWHMCDLIWLMLFPVIYLLH